MKYFYIRILRVCGSYGYITQARSLLEAKDAVIFWRGMGDIQKGLDKGIAIFEIISPERPLNKILSLYDSYPVDRATEILSPMEKV